MNAKKKSNGLRIFIVLFVLLLILGWFGTCYFIEKKVEGILLEALQKQGLQDKVQWKSISASPFKVVVLKDVMFQQSDHLHYKADSIRISDVINQQDRLRIRLQITRLQSILSAKMQERLSANAVGDAMRPIDSSIMLDLDFGKDQGRLVSDNQVQDLYDLDVHWEISNIAVLRDILKQKFPNLALNTDSAHGNPTFGLLAISLNSLDARLHDRGAVAKWLPPATKAGEKDDITGQMVRGGMQALQKGCAYALPERALSCQHLTDFAQGKKDSLRLTVRPEQPVPMWRLVRVNQKETIRLLDIRLE